MILWRRLDRILGFKNPYGEMAKKRLAGMCLELEEHLSMVFHRYIAGEAGQRNKYRGDGYFDVDSGLSKVWKLHEAMDLKFAWEVFNATNSVRFDTNPTTSQGGLNNQLTSGTLGQYSSTLTIPRVQQFSLRFTF